MEIISTRNSCLNTTLLDSADRPLFKVKTPRKFGFRTTTTISKITTDDPLISPSSSPTTLTDKDGLDRALTASSRKSDEKSLLREHAQIQWRCFSPSMLRFHEMELEVKKYLCPKGFLRKHRVFTGPDGQSYQWTLKFLSCVLETNDEARIPVARTHCRRYGIFGGQGRKATLEIYPTGQHMVDAIVVTFLYVDQVRRDREESMVHWLGPLSLIVVLALHCGSFQCRR